MSSHPLENAYWCSQIALAIIAIAGALFAYMQILASERLELMKYLQQEVVRNARSYVYTKLLHKPYSEWTDEDKDKAGTVVASFDVMGRVLIGKSIFGSGQIKFFAKSWSAIIVKNYELLLKFRDERICQNHLGYYEGFDFLYTIAVKDQKARKKAIPRE